MNTKLTALLAIKSLLNPVIGRMELFLLTKAQREITKFQMGVSPEENVEPVILNLFNSVIDARSNPENIAKIREAYKAFLISDHPLVPEVVKDI